MSNKDNVGEFDMKKRITFTVIFICSLFTVAYAQELKSKRYYNAELDEVGSASIGFLSKTPILPEFFEQILSSKENATVIEKLSKMTVWLCNQALDEYDFKEGESYVVICRSASVPYQSVSVFLTITEQGRFFKWWAFVEEEQ